MSQNFMSNSFLLILSFMSGSVAQSCFFVTSWTEAGKNTRLARPGSSVYRIFQARILDWVTISSSRGSSQDQTHISCMRLHWQANSLPLNHLEIPNKQILQFDMSSTRLIHEKFNNYLLTVNGCLYYYFKSTFSHQVPIRQLMTHTVYLRSSNGLLQQYIVILFQQFHSQIP